MNLYPLQYAQDMIDRGVTFALDILERIQSPQDQEKHRRDAIVTACFLEVRDIQVRIATFLARPGAWFRTCKQVASVKPAFIQANTALVWDYLMDYYTLDTRKAISCYLEQSLLTSIEEIQEVHLDASWGDTTCAEIISRFSNCRELFIGQSAQLTDEGMIAIAQKCTKLVALAFDNQYYMSDLSGPVQGTATMQLHMHGPYFGDAALAAIATHCPELKEINISCCGKATEEGLLGLTTVRPQLEFLGISGWQQISNAGIAAITRMCPQLTSLNLAMSFPLTDEALDAISKNCTHLVEIDLSGLYNCTYGGLYTFLQRRHGLTSIRMDGLDQVRDGMLVLIAEHSPELAELSLCACPNISDTGLFLLAERCQKLVYIDLSFCPDITDAGVERIAEMCPHLAFMILLGAPQITKERIERMTALRPNCEIQCNKPETVEEETCFLS